jgi:hypothetical protein
MLDCIFICISFGIHRNTTMVKMWLVGGEKVVMTRTLTFVSLFSPEFCSNMAAARPLRYRKWAGKAKREVWNGRHEIS